MSLAPSFAFRRAVICFSGGHRDRQGAFSESSRHTCLHQPHVCVAPVDLRRYLSVMVLNLSGGGFSVPGTTARKGSHAE